MVYVFSSNIPEAEASRSVSSRPAWFTELVPEQPGQHREDKNKNKTFDSLWKNKKNDDKSWLFLASLDKLAKDNNKLHGNNNLLLA